MVPAGVRHVVGFATFVAEVSSTDEDLWLDGLTIDFNCFGNLIFDIIVGGVDFNFHGSEFTSGSGLGSLCEPDELRICGGQSTLFIGCEFTSVFKDNGCCFALDWCF